MKQNRHFLTTQTSFLAHPFLKRLFLGMTLLSSLFLAACSESSANNSGDSHNRENSALNEENTFIQELRFGASPGDFSDMIRDYLAPELKKAGYPVKLQEISDIVAPNIGVNEGSLDANLFQHKPYLDEFNRNFKATLTPVIQVPTAPYGIYPARLKTLSELKEGALIGIPSNITNFARGLHILANLGWITLKESDDPLHITKKEIAENPYNLQILEIEAAQVVRALPDLDYAIINGNFAGDAGIPFTDALAIEQSKFFVNWIVVREADKDAPWVTILREIIDSAGFKAYAAERFAGYNLPPSWDEEEER